MQVSNELNKIKPTKVSGQNAWTLNC